MACEGRAELHKEGEEDARAVPGRPTTSDPQHVQQQSCEEDRDGVTLVSVDANKTNK